MLAKVAVYITAIFGILFAAVFISALCGGFFGLVMGWFFPSTMSMISDMLDIPAEPWQLGVIFGFIGGFFRSYNTNPK